MVKTWSPASSRKTTTTYIVSSSRSVWFFTRTYSIGRAKTKPATQSTHVEMKMFMNLPRTVRQSSTLFSQYTDASDSREAYAIGAPHPSGSRRLQRLVCRGSHQPKQSCIYCTATLSIQQCTHKSPSGTPASPGRSRSRPSSSTPPSATWSPAARRRCTARPSTGTPSRASRS